MFSWNKLTTDRQTRQTDRQTDRQTEITLPAFVLSIYCHDREKQLSIPSGWMPDSFLYF